MVHLARAYFNEVRMLLEICIIVVTYSTNVKEHWEWYIAWGPFVENLSMCTYSSVTRF